MAYLVDRPRFLYFTTFLIVNTLPWPKYSESISIVEFYLKNNNFSQNWKLFRCSNIVILIHNILMHTHWWWKPTWEFRTRRTQLLSKISSLSCGTLVIEVIREYFIFNGWKSLLTPHSLDSSSLTFYYRFVLYEYTSATTVLDTHFFGIFSGKKKLEQKK